MMDELVRFEMSEQRLVIADGRTGKVLRTGEPLGLPVVQVEQIPGVGRAVVRLDHTSVEGDFRNVLCVDDQARVVWQAELPSAPSGGPDSYVEVGAVSTDTIMATSWSCYRVTLDAAHGRIIDQTFTK